jgi:indole-3-glycerol phosphate synthase
MADRGSGVLERILVAKKDEVAQLERTPCPPRPEVPRGASVAGSLARGRTDPLRLITEIKRRSPSAGALSTRLSVAERAVVYARNGATMISVLCDAPFFDGGWHHVEEARRALDAAGLTVPILAKEFVIHARQLEEAAARGAASVLLIARIVGHAELGELYSRAVMLGLEPLVEVVNEDEVGAALEAGARVIGVNARDLDTLVMDAARAARVLAAIPEDRIAVHLSGLKGPEDVRSIARTSADAALLGEALMRADDPSALLGAMVDGARTAEDFVPDAAR